MHGINVHLITCVIALISFPPPSLDLISNGTLKITGWNVYTDPQHLDDPDYFKHMILWGHMPRMNLYDQVLQDVRNEFKQKDKLK